MAKNFGEGFAEGFAPSFQKSLDSTLQQGRDLDIAKLKAFLEQQSPAYKADLEMKQAHTKLYQAEAEQKANPLTNFMDSSQAAEIMGLDEKKKAAFKTLYPAKVPIEHIKMFFSSDRILNQQHQQKALEDERKYRHTERRSNERSKILERFAADPAIKRAQQSIDGATNIIGLVESGNPVAHAAIPTFMARASGEVGALTEADKAPFGGSRAIVERIKAVTKEAATGKLTEANMKFVVDLARVMERSANANMDKLARMRAKQYSKASEFLKDSEDEIFESFRPESIQVDAASQKGTAQPGAVALTGPKAARLAELRKKAAGGKLNGSK